MTPEEIDAGIAEVRDWLDDYPEGTVLALFEARAWEVKGYPSWEALCAAEFPRTLPIARTQRRELVGRFAESGMSTRAIAAAVGVDDKTIRNDLAGADISAPVTGLDGKTYTRPPRTAVVDVETGEILNEELTSEVWEIEQGPTLEEIFETDPDVIAARRRHRLTSYLVAVGKPHLLDPEEMARIAPDLAENVDRSLASFQKWAAAYRAALPRRLSAVKEK